jgi:hypothetical protein
VPSVLIVPAASLSFCIITRREDLGPDGPPGEAADVGGEYRRLGAFDGGLEALGEPAVATDPLVKLFEYEWDNGFGN